MSLCHSDLFRNWISSDRIFLAGVKTMNLNQMKTLATHSDGQLSPISSSNLETLWCKTILCCLISEGILLYHCTVVLGFFLFCFVFQQINFSIWSPSGTHQPAHHQLSQSKHITTFFWLFSLKFHIWDLNLAPFIRSISFCLALHQWLKVNCLA